MCLQSCINLGAKRLKCFFIFFFLLLQCLPCPLGALVLFLFFFFLVGLPLLFLPFDFPLTTPLPCSGVALLFITICTGEEKAHGFHLEAVIYYFWLVLIIITLLHLISPNIFGDLQICSWKSFPPSSTVTHPFLFQHVFLSAGTLSWYF